MRKMITATIIITVFLGITLIAPAGPGIMTPGVKRIKIIPVEDAEGELAILYQRLIYRGGKISNFASAFSLSPPLLELQDRAFQTVITEEGALQITWREVIVMVISQVNRSDYGAKMYRQDLERRGMDKGIIDRIWENYTDAGLNPLLVALIDFAKKVNSAPYNMTDEDFEIVRQAGADDPMILETVHLVAYIKYINTLADALGIQPEV